MANVVQAMLFQAIFFYLWYDSLSRSLEEVEDMPADRKSQSEVAPFDMPALANVMVVLVAKSVLAAALVAGALLLLQEGLSWMHAYRPAGLSVSAVELTMPAGMDTVTFTKERFEGLNVLFHDLVCVLLVYRLNMLFTKYYVASLVDAERLKDKAYVRAHVLTIYVSNLFLFVGSFTAASYFMRRMVAAAQHP